MKKLLRKSELAALIGMTPRGVECLVAARKISALRISRKCVRFDPDKVLAELGKFEQKAVA